MELKFDKKASRGLVITIFCVIIGYMLLKETERVKAVWNFLSNILSPFVFGALLAFILNVPLRFFEARLKGLKNEKVRRVVAIVVMTLVIAFVLTGIILLLVPPIEETIDNLISQLPGFIMHTGEIVDLFLTEHPELRDILGIHGAFLDINWASLVDTIMNALETSVSGIVSSAMGLVGGLASGLVNLFFSVIFAFYCLCRKETLARQGRKLLYSFVKEPRADEVVRVLRITNSTFSNFITGQTIEAVILGLLFVPAMIVFRMPYIPLICVVITITALVPLIGAFAGCILGAFLILVNDPMQAVVFVIMFLVIQQFEGNVIYPKVVGESIGLPGMWVLLAVAIGGGTMGIMGMFLMVPLASVIYRLLREFSTRRVSERHIDPEKLECQPPELQPHFMFNIRKRRKAKKAAKTSKKEAPKGE
jgi:predicted PurR-regulated permease PerM